MTEYKIRKLVNYECNSQFTDGDDDDDEDENKEIIYCLCIM